MDSQSRCVVVTGFGPFRQHLVNSSWEAVKVLIVYGTSQHRNQDVKWRKEHFMGKMSDKLPSQELSKLGLGVDTNIELRTLQLPVDYREVSRRLTTIWEDLRPQLVVHVGMDPSTKAIFLEQCGKNRSYRDTDIRGFQPEGGVCLSGGPEVMHSVVSMKEVCRRVSVEDVEVAFSRDAGRYVCDYTYYLSLYLGNGHAALIHVPPLSHRLPASLLGRALQVIIQEMLEDSEVQTPKYSTQREAAGGCLL